MKRYLVRKVVCDDKTMGLSVVEVDDDGKVVSVTPFARETESTRQYDGVMVIQSGKVVGLDV